MQTPPDALTFAALSFKSIRERQGWEAAIAVRFPGVHLRFIDLHGRDGFTPSIVWHVRVDGVKPSLPKCSGKSMNRRCALSRVHPEKTMPKLPSRGAYGAAVRKQPQVTILTALTCIRQRVRSPRCTGENRPEVTCVDS